MKLLAIITAAGFLAAACVERPSKEVSEVSEQSSAEDLDLGIVWSGVDPLFAEPPLPPDDAQEMALDMISQYDDAVASGHRSHTPLPTKTGLFWVMKSSFAHIENWDSIVASAERSGAIDVTELVETLRQHYSPLPRG